MNQSRIDIRCGSLFPWHFQFIAALVLIAGLVLLIERPGIGIVLAVAGGFILTAATGTEIDTSKNTYREYTSYYFLLKGGKHRKFVGAEKVFINIAKVSNQMHTAYTNRSATFSKQEYNAYLKLLDGTKIHLLTSNKKEKLAIKLHSIASFLNIPIQDNTTVVS